MKFKPKHNQVVIKQQNKKEQKHGSIIVPDIGQERPLLGEVIAIGPGTPNINGSLIPMQSKVGEIVAFPAFGGAKIKVGNDEFVVVRDNDIYTTIEDEDIKK